MKRFLALALAIVMVLCTFVGCGPKEDEGGKTDPGKTDTKSNGVLMGISVGDPGELLKLFTGENPIKDIKDVYLQIAANDKSELIYGLGAKLFGEKHALKLFYGEDVVISAPSLVDKNYGISVEALMELITASQAKPEVGSGTMAPAADADVTVGAAMNPSAVLELLPVLANYGDDLLAELKTNAGLTVTEEGGKIKVKGTVTSDAAAVVFTNLFLKLCEDDEFMTIMSMITGMSAEDLRKDLPAKDEMVAQFKQEFGGMQFSANVDLTLEKDTDALKAMDVSINVGAAAMKINMAFDVDKETFSFSALENNFPRITVNFADGKLDFDMQVDSQVIEGSFSFGDTKITAFVKVAGQEVFRLNVEIYDDGFDFVMSTGGSQFGMAAKETNGEVVLTLSSNGVEAFKVNMTKKVSGTKTTFTVKSMSAQNVTMDLSAVELSFYIDTNYSLEKAPAYESLENKTEAELQAILQKIMTDNQELIQKLSQLFAPEIVM